MKILSFFFNFYFFYFFPLWRQILLRRRWFCSGMEPGVGRSGTAHSCRDHPPSWHHLALGAEDQAAFGNKFPYLTLLINFAWRTHHYTWDHLNVRCKYIDKCLHNWGCWLEMGAINSCTSGLLLPQQIRMVKMCQVIEASWSIFFHLYFTGCTLQVFIYTSS